MWLEEKSQPAPRGFAKVKNDPESPGNSFLTPEDMMAILNAVSPYDLYQNPDSSPKMLDYPTSAFNINNRIGKMGISQAIVQASRASKRPLSNVLSTADSALMNYTEEDRPYAAQGIYEHEKAHFKDPRLNPMANNRGWLMYAGLPGNIAAREVPAMRSEDRFFENLRRNRKR